MIQLAWRNQYLNEAVWHTAEGEAFTKWEGHLCRECHSRSYEGWMDRHLHFVCSNCVELVKTLDRPKDWIVKAAAIRFVRLHADGGVWGLTKRGGVYCLGFWPEGTNQFYLDTPLATFTEEEALWLFQYSDPTRWY